MIILLSYLSILFGFCFSVFVTYNVTVRYLKIKDLPTQVIKTSEKKDYLETLTGYSKFCMVSVVINIIGLFTTVMEFRFILAIGSIILVGNIFSDLLDEISDFDSDKKDSDILLDYLKAAKEDSKKKAEENKIKKMDSLNLTKEDVDNINEHKK
jgi:hypothetical protein